jgi:hypothetical protein
MLWVQIRNETEMSTDVFCIDLSTKETAQPPLSSTIDWWDSLLVANTSQAIFSSIVDQENPGALDLKVVDLIQPKVIETISQVVVHHASGQEVKYSHQGNQSMPELTKSLIDNLDVDNLFELEIPSAYPEGHTYHKLVATFLQKYEAVPIGPIMYLEKGSNIIISYHTQVDKLIERHLLWLDAGEIQLHKIIDKEMKGVSLESFLTFGQYLIFASERQFLEIYLMT